MYNSVLSNKDIILAMCVILRKGKKKEVKLIFKPHFIYPNTSKTLSFQHINIIKY